MVELSTADLEVPGVAPDASPRELLDCYPLAAGDPLAIRSRKEGFFSSVRTLLRFLLSGPSLGEREKYRDISVYVFTYV